MPGSQDFHRPAHSRDVRRFVEPAADSRRVGHGDVADTITKRCSSHDSRERGDRSQERADGQQAHKEDDPGLERLDQLVKPGAAETLFLEGGHAVSLGSRQASGVAASDGGEMDLAVKLLARMPPCSSQSRSFSPATPANGLSCSVARKPGAWPISRTHGRGASGSGSRAIGMDSCAPAARLHGICGKPGCGHSGR